MTWIALVLPALAATPVDADADGWTTLYDCDDGDAAVLPWHCGGDDLLVDGTSRTLGGTRSYDHVWVINGGSIVIPAYGSTGRGGRLTLVADAIYVDASSSILGTGAGHPGGSALRTAGQGPAAGGAGSDDSLSFAGGAGHGGRGSDGMEACYAVDGARGGTYGYARDARADMGSGGGGVAGAAGGAGGGALTLLATDVWIDGEIRLEGSGGRTAGENRASGGGAGGELVVDAERLVCTGTVSVQGGGSATYNPYIGASGGGGGGRVQLWGPRVDITACTISVEGGSAACGDGPPRAGSLYLETP